MKGQSGLTMVELMVSLAIVLIIIAAATAAYLKIMSTYSTQGALSENFMGNLTGFELLRYDIEMAGFGLPESMNGIAYTEALAKGAYSGTKPPYDPATLNDEPNVPHAFVLSTAGEPTISGNTSEVLAIKSTMADINSASSHTALLSANGLENGGTLVNGDHYIAIENTGALVAGQNNAWDDTFGQSSLPNTNGQVYYLYGLSTSETTMMPFNRVDYYLNNSNVPKYCASNTYVLYRSVVSQVDGTLEPSPLINCVEDFQVAFGIDPSGDGTKAIVWQSNLNQDNIPGGQAGTEMTAAQMQQYLREVKVYVLYQAGHGEAGTTPTYRFSGTLSLGQDINLSPLGGKSFTPTGVNAQYRWKVVEIDAKPMNMLNRW